MSVGVMQDYPLKTKEICCGGNFIFFISFFFPLLGPCGRCRLFHDPSAMDDEEMEGRLLSVACQVDAR